MHAILAYNVQILHTFKYDRCQVVSMNSTTIKLQNPKYQTCIDACCRCMEACEACCTACMTVPMQNMQQQNMQNMQSMIGMMS